jgi:hypothetical protein
MIYLVATEPGELLQIGDKLHSGHSQHQYFASSPRVFKNDV